jgi:hypothetical protein
MKPFLPIFVIIPFCKFYLCVSGVTESTLYYSCSRAWVLLCRKIEGLISAKCQKFCVNCVCSCVVLSHKANLNLFGWNIWHCSYVLQGRQSVFSYSLVCDLSEAIYETIIDPSSFCSLRQTPFDDIPLIGHQHQPDDTASHIRSIHFSPEKLTF